MDTFDLLISKHGLALVFANVLLTQLGLPAPAIPLLIVAGAYAAVGRLSAGGVFAVAFVATMLADTVWYLSGRRYGNGVMKAICRVSLTPDSCVAQTQMLFERWGARSLAVAKFVPGFAIIAPPLAGASRVGWSGFLTFSALGASLWISAGMVPGMLFAAQVEQLLAALEAVGNVTVPFAGALFVAWIGYKWAERYRFLKLIRMARIGVDELYRSMNSGAQPAVLDVRSRTARSLEPRRIPGARHVPLDAIDRHAADASRDRDVVLYCTCPNEVSAVEAAKLLMDRGFVRVRPLRGGLDAWIAAGYPVEAIAS